MSLYHVHFLDSRGELLDQKEIDCRVDDEAIDHTGFSEHSHGIQLWNGDRLVAQFPALGAVRDWRLGK